MPTLLTNVRCWGKSGHRNSRALRLLLTHERHRYEGRNMHLEYRWAAGDLERTRRFAQEIVDLKPDLIVVHSTPAVDAVRKLTTTIPMVFTLIADPLGSGFAASLARPGGNM